MDGRFAEFVNTHGRPTFHMKRLWSPRAGRRRLGTVIYVAIFAGWWAVVGGMIAVAAVVRHEERLAWRALWFPPAIALCLLAGGLVLTAVLKVLSA
jgi:hypothetical protein